MDERNDNQLVEAFIAGDQLAYEEIIQRYHKNVYWLAYKYTSKRSDAEDITQDTFLRAYENLLKHPKEVKLKAWLMTICTNLCRNKAKKKKSFNFSALESPDDERNYADRIVSKTQDPSEAARSKENVNSVQDAIERLPEKYQLVIQLRYIQDLSYNEIAEALSIPLNTVKVHINRAKKQLEQSLSYEHS